ncbi:MAG TPA: tripartite tricarboxylate transporter TctB family protein [Nocardioidaceae bacterium]|nr:tripartite tricarboxylate transporter TctB family protein [Nocardioidaceae bacterium]
MSILRTQVRDLPAGQLVFPAGVAALAVYVLLGAADIVEPISAGAVGPRVLPYLVGGGMLVAALAALVSVLRGDLAEAEGGEDVDPDRHTSWLTVAALVALFALHIVLIAPLGWPLAAAVLFTGAAWTFGAKPRGRAAVIGTAIAFVLQTVFAGGLGVSLPPGPLFEGVPFLHG